MEALLAIDLKDSAMLIAEQNVALLEGTVDRVIGMHAGKLKGEASSSFRLVRPIGRGRRMDIPFILVNAITVACIYGLIAVAVSITWSSLGLINLAYGFIYSFAGYAAWLVATYVARQYIDPTLSTVVIAGRHHCRRARRHPCLLASSSFRCTTSRTSPSRGMIATLAISLIGSAVVPLIVRPDGEVAA